MILKKALLLLYPLPVESLDPAVLACAAKLCPGAFKHSWTVYMLANCSGAAFGTTMTPVSLLSDMASSSDIAIVTVGIIP